MPRTEWGDDDQRPVWVPKWIPSVTAIKMTFPSSIENMKTNLSRPTKDKKEAAIELTIVLFEAVSFLLMIVGLAPAILPWNATQIVGLVLILLGSLFFLTSAATLGARLSFLPSTLPSSEANSTFLITDGIYKHCRHPMYFGTVTASVGLSLLTLSSARLFWTTALWLALEVKAGMEELILHEQFAKEYSKYAAQTPKFIPGIGRLIPGRDETFTPLEEEPGVVIDRIAE